jgi:hypothetical protein
MLTDKVFLSVGLVSCSGGSRVEPALQCAGTATRPSRRVGFRSPHCSQGLGFRCCRFPQVRLRFWYPRADP